MGFHIAKAYAQYGKAQWRKNLGRYESLQIRCGRQGRHQRQPEAARGQVRSRPPLGRPPPGERGSHHAARLAPGEPVEHAPQQRPRRQGDPARHAASTDALRDRLTALEARRRSTGQAVEQVLATWHGEAAERFRSHWEEWDRGALLVVERLAAGIAALDLLRADTVGVDRYRAECSTHLAGRLG